MEASCQRECWLRRRMFTLTELGFVLKVLLNHAPFLPPFPGLMQDLSGELFSHATQKVHLGDHRGLLLHPLCISWQGSENQGCDPELGLAALSASTDSRIMCSETVFFQNSQVAMALQKQRHLMKQNSTASESTYHYKSCCDNNLTILQEGRMKQLILRLFSFLFVFWTNKQIMPWTDNDNSDCAVLSAQINALWFFIFFYGSRTKTYV